MFKQNFQLFMTKQDAKLISVPLAGQGWGVVRTVAEPPRRLKSQGFPLQHSPVLQRGEMWEVLFRPTKEEIKVET